LPKIMNFVWLKFHYILECYNNGDDSYKGYSRKRVRKNGTGLVMSLKIHNKGKLGSEGNSCSVKVMYFPLKANTSI